MDEVRSFAFVTQYFPPERGAAQVRLGAVTQELVQRGIEVAVLTAVPNYPLGRTFPGWSKRPFQSTVAEGIRVHRVLTWPALGSGLGRAANYLSFGFMSTISLPFLRPADWTVVEYPTLFGALPTVAWCRLRRRRVVVYVADLWVDALSEVGGLPSRHIERALRRGERWMLRHADAVTAVTDGVRHAVTAAGVPDDRICMLPNGADPAMFSPDGSETDDGLPSLPSQDHLFVYAGTHGFIHGLDVVLDAAELLLPDPSIGILMVGGGSERQRLVDEAARRGLKNITFWEPVDPTIVAALLRRAVAGIACTRPGQGSQPIRSAKMLPVMASTRPVIYSGDDEGARLIEGLGAGLRVAPGDGAALASAIRAVVEDPQAAAEMGRRGREYVLAEGNWSVLVGHWLADLDRLSSQRPRSRVVARTAP